MQKWRWIRCVWLNRFTRALVTYSILSFFGRDMTVFTTVFLLKPPTLPPPCYMLQSGTWRGAVEVGGRAGDLLGGRNTTKWSFLKFWTFPSVVWHELNVKWVLFFCGHLGTTCSFTDVPPSGESCSKEAHALEWTAKSVFLCFHGRPSARIIQLKVKKHILYMWWNQCWRLSQQAASAPIEAEEEFWL